MSGNAGVVEGATGSILDQFGILAEKGTLELHQAGRTILSEGEEGDCMFVIKHGYVEVTSGGQFLAMLSDGEVLGEMALIDMKPRSATAIATTDCELIRIDRDQFVELAKGNYDFFVFMMTVQSERLRRMNDAYTMRSDPLRRPSIPQQAPVATAESGNSSGTEKRWTDL